MLPFDLSSSIFAFSWETENYLKICVYNTQLGDIVLLLKIAFL